MLSRLGFPPIGEHRRFVGALGIDALGSGIWMPLSLLYFLHETHLDLVQLGLAMTVANALVFPMVPAVGHFVDALGAKKMMQSGNVIQAVAFALYPLASNTPEVGAVVAAATLGRTCFWGANGPLITQITRPGERELWFGFVGALRNAGYGVGGVLAAVALGIGTHAAYHAVVLANAASYVGAFVLMLGVSGGQRPAPAAASEGGWRVVLRDRAYRWLIASTFCYAMTEMVLNVAMPVYFAHLLHLPGWIPGVVFVINTVMIGVGQGLVVRTMTGVVRIRVLLTAICFTASSFAMFWTADALSVRTGLVLVLAAAVVYTLGEMVAGPVVGALAAETPPPALRGRYMSANQLAWNASGAIAPLVYTALLARGSAAMWGGALVVCLLWSLVLVVVRRRMPLAGRPVTNAAVPG
ncbi:MAG: MFS transporter [Marmoricola sp.]